MDNTTFFAMLFDEGEATCLSSHQKGTKVYDVERNMENASNWANLFCINPLHPTKDLNPTEEYHHVDKPRRCDKNVVAYRNILIEMDNRPIEEQKKLVEELGIPWTTAVFSGGKSIHYIISLEEGLADEAIYRRTVERIHKAMGGKGVVDTACKNPSRLSRIPGAYREDKSQYQTLIEVKDRVKNSDLEAWLVSKGCPAVEPQKKTARKVYNGNTDTGLRCMNGFTLNFIMFGAPEGERNLSLFKAACDLFKCGYEEDEVYDRLEGPSGLDRQEVERTIKSAQRKVESEQETI